MPSELFNETVERLRYLTGRLDQVEARLEEMFTGTVDTEQDDSGRVRVMDESIAALGDVEDLIEERGRIYHGAVSTLGELDDAELDDEDEGIWEAIEQAEAEWLPYVFFLLAQDEVQRSREDAEDLDDGRRYLNVLPSGEDARQVASGLLRVVHNHVRPEGFPDVSIGWQGFRIWLQPPDHALPVETCDCCWAPDLPVHYRVDREATAVKRAKDLDEEIARLTAIREGLDQ